MDYTDEMLVKTTQTEEMVRTKGWENVEKYIKSQINQITDKLIKETKSVDELFFYRGQISAYQNLLLEIDSDIQNLKNWREKSKSTTSE